MIYPPVVLPGPTLTFQSLYRIIQSGSFWSETVVTLQRLVIALLTSIIAGSLLGIIMGANQKLKNLFEPIVYLIQAVPPILYMTLAMIWFGLNGRATIFIVFIGSAPVMAVTIKEGFENIDPRLIEMGKAFKFSPTETIREIILPSLSAYFKAGLITVFSFGWKLVVMGEVLSASTGLGAQITDARMNLETHMVFAWGIVVIVLCFLFQKITAKIFEFKPKRRKSYDK
ncbi:ABC transporter permease [Desulfoscipio sp. XC116]|uniref:ABC transporter permease n=1 Tax=Desulfoscipio sp. XC116 TaxID=3144975 RepID=UPI00325A7FB0